MFRLAQFRKRDKGNEQVQKYRIVPKSASEPITCGHATTEEYMVTFQAEHTYFERVNEKSIKNLLAEEMSREAVAKKKSPSVISKLIGLDGVSSLNLDQRENVSLWNMFAKKTVSAGTKWNEEPRDSKSSKKNLVGKHGLRDTFDYQEEQNVAARPKSSKQIARMDISKGVAFVQMHNEEFHKKSDNIPGHLRSKSNQDLMEKFLQQPDSLFVKHVLDQQGRSSSSQCSHIAVLRPKKSIKCEAKAKGWQEESVTLRKCDLDSYRRHDDELLEHFRGRATHTSHRSSKIQLETKEQTNISSKRIIVLKPSFGQTDNSTQRVSHDDWKQDLAINMRKAGSSAEKGVFNETKYSCPKCRDARETAKVITRQMRDSLDSLDNLYTSKGKSEVRRFAPKERSYMFDSDSEAVITLTSRNVNSDWYVYDNRQMPREAESSVSREAKKRISKRWKMIHGYVDVEGVSQNSTLGEMLSTPYRSMRPENLNAVKVQDGTRASAYTAEWDTPMGISSNDGWKHGYLSSSSISGSVPQSFVSRRHKSSKHLIGFAEERLLKHRDATKRNRNMAGKGHVSHRESKNLKYKNKKLHRPSDSSSELFPILPTYAQSNSEIDDLVEVKSMHPQAPDCISNIASVVDTKTNASVTVCSDSSIELIPLLSTCVLGDGNSFALHEDVTDLQGLSNETPEVDYAPLQFHGPEAVAEGSVTCKEAYHYSPVSILGVPSTENSSSGSKCFERVNADLQELKMHLQQLKMESDERCVTEKTISGGKEPEKEEMSFDEEGLVEFDCWESSYIVDLLVESGLYGAEPGLLISNCYSPNSPLDPLLFDILEKKYSDEITGPRPMRKLLYDHINELLLKIYQSVMDSCPWVKSAGVGLSSDCQMGRVEEQLQKLLDIHEKEVNRKVSDTVFDKQKGWFEPREFVDAIGKQIQEMLFDDLITEVINM